MARRRRNRRRNRSTAARLERQYRYRSRITEETLQGEQYRENQSEFMKAFRRKAKEAAEQTVFVTNVSDLRVQANLSALQGFLARYGPVAFCRRHHYDGRSRTPYPPALVRFKRAEDAASLFNVDSLLRVGNKPIRVACPIGHRGFILVRRYKHVNEIAQEEMTSPVIDVSAQRMSLGHWYPHRQGEESGVWLEVETAKERSRTISDTDSQNLGGVAEMLAWMLKGSGPSSISTTMKEFEPTFQIDLVKREVRIIHLGSAGTIREIMTFRFKQLEAPMKLCRDKNGAQSIVFSLKHPPKLEREEVCLPHFDTRTVRRVTWASVETETFGICLGYKIFLHETAVWALQQHIKYDDLKSFGVLDLDFSQDIESQYIGFSQEILWNDMVASVENIRLRLLLCSLRDAGCFCAYDAINDDTTIFELVQRYDPKRAEKALEIMQAHQVKTRFPRLLFFETVESVLSDEPIQNLPDHCVSIPKLVVTPTRVVTTGFEVETSNRAIRLFHLTHGFPVASFARIQVVDENMDSVFAHDLNGCVEDRFRKLFNRGLRFAGMHFAFLAYSSSQLREASFWAVSIPERVGCRSIEEMRSKLGKINEKTVSKYAARLGQCFSTTFCEPHRSPGLSSRFTHIEVPDIRSAGGCHSDGTGLITRAAMNRVLGSVPFAPKDLLDVGIIQIRFKGAKGTLVAWDARYLDRDRVQYDVILRKSMIKFDSEHNDLEVCSIGKRVPYHLNRNVIFLLDALDVPRRVFLSLQKEMLDLLDNMLHSRVDALNALPRLSGIDSAQKAMLLHMLHSGFSPSTEPFLHSALASIRCHHLFDLRKKSRIFVEKGAVLMGGLDETGLLEEGTVFIQIKDESREGPEYKPLLGPVLITKHPVMHPGDLRMLRAVDVPALRGCRNVILFSQKGARPEASKMAGSDLDGDEFACTWDERLFLKEWNQCKRVSEDLYISKDGSPLYIAELGGANTRPMDFSPAEGESMRLVPQEPEELSGVLIDHLLDHIKNASVGQICGLWWDYASRDGPLCDVCLALAELHSIAVDYPKSGIPAKVPKDYLWKDNPRAHWREKGATSFHCDSVVGRLYDQVISRLESTKRATRNEVVGLAGRQMDKYGTILCRLGPIDDNRLKGTPYYMPRIFAKLGLERDVQSRRLVEMAVYQRCLYNQDLLQLMNTHRVRGEGEVYTGCIRKYHKLHKKRQHEFAQDIRRRYGMIHSQHRRLFFRLVAVLAHERNKDGGVFSEQFDDVENDDKTDQDMDSDSDDSSVGLDLESDEEMIHRLLSEENESLDEEVKWIQEVVLSKNETIDDEPNESIVVLVAFALAGAWYEAAYCPDLQSSTTLLFSFPWIVADVIARRLTESDCE